jgi:cytochrome b561
VKRYGAVAQAAHWLTVLLLAGSFTLGFYMEELVLSPTKLKLFAYHKWIGISIFLLVAMRLAWRLWSPPPPLPASMPRWEVRAAEISHHLLYLFLFAVPLSGWLMSSAKGFQTVLFGALPLPDLLSKNPPLGEALEEVHWLLNKMLLGLVLVHITAALKHHFIDRDEVLARMVPGLSPPDVTENPVEPK